MVAVICIAAVLFLHNEYRYARQGKTVDGRVTLVTKEFARFANSDRQGMRPIYRYRCDYRYAIDGDVRQGEFTTESGGVREGDVVTVQYIPGSPDRDRVVTSGAKFFRILVLALLASPILIICIASLNRLQIVTGVLTRFEPWKIRRRASGG